MEESNTIRFTPAERAASIMICVWVGVPRHHRLLL